MEYHSLWLDLNCLGYGLSSREEATCQHCIRPLLRLQILAVVRLYSSSSAAKATVVIDPTSSTMVVD